MRRRSTHTLTGIPTLQGKDHTGRSAGSLSGNWGSYEILKDPDKRREKDATGSLVGEWGAGAGAVDMEALLRELMRQQGGMGGMGVWVAWAAAAWAKGRQACRDVLWWRYGGKCAGAWVAAARAAPTQAVPAKKWLRGPC